MPISWPIRTTRSLIRALRRRADAARDARLWQVAAVLYEEALAHDPRNGRLHIQCGHMWKEAGGFAQAERHYQAAAELMPDDADLALQLGHFFKVANQPDQAERSYRRALTLQPGWDEAARELRMLSGTGQAVSGRDDILPELLPAAPAALAGEPHEGITVQRLGGEMVQGASGTWRVLRGIQAIRGWCISTQPLTSLSVTMDGEEIAVAPLAALPDQPRKYCFNLWHDFSTATPGETKVELHVVGARGRVRSHRAILMVAPPLEDAALLASDAYVPLPPGSEPLDVRINGLPSIVRSSRRALFPSPRVVLVQRVDQLGDLVCSVPAIRRLRALFPEARLVGLLSAANADLGRSLDLFDQIVVADFPEQDGRRVMTAGAQRQLGERLRGLSIDLAIDLSEGADSRPLLRLSGAPFLYGFGLRQFPWLSAGLEVGAPDPLDRLETTAHARKLSALVESLAAMRTSAAVTLPRPTDQADEARRLAHGVRPGMPYVMLHTGARLAFSRWPGFAILATLLLARTRLDVVLLHDGDTPPSGLPDDPRLRVIGGRLPFDDFDALIGGAALFVGNDSGPKHLAALRGTEVVSLHMARLNWNEWGQEQAGLIISRRVPCAGCGISDQPGECGRDFACLRLIGPEEVLEAVLSRLDE